MRLSRRILVPAIIALSAAGSILASSAVPVMDASAPAAVAAAPGTYYHN